MATTEVKGVIAPNGTIHDLYYKRERFKANLPLEGGQPSYGVDGQILRTNGDGTTEWVNVGTPTEEQINDAVADWLDDHPEATTTVQDGAITKQKFADGVTELFDGTGFYDEVIVTSGTYTNTDGNSTTYYLAEIPKYDSEDNLIEIFAGYDTTKTPLTYAQANLTTLTTNTSLDLATGEKPAVIANGVIVRESTFDDAISNYPFVVYVGFDSDRVPHEYSINTAPEVMINDGIKHATAAFFRLVTDGEARDVSNIGLSAAALKVNPRMAMFTKSDDSICFLACNGRENVDEGLTPSELANLMISLGAVQGWNLDGGGSTSMVTKGSKINRNIDDNGTRDRGIRVTWNVGRKYSNPATQQAIAQIGVEKQRLIQQLETYFSDAAVPVQNGKDPIDLDGGIYYVNNAVNVPTSVDDGFVQVFKKYGSSGLKKVWWYPYNSDVYYEKHYDGSSWSSWVKKDPNEMWKYGPSISSGANLNSYTSAGKYRVLNASAANGITNIPVKSPGALYVIELNQASVILQLYFAGNGKMYSRRIITSTPSYEDWTLYTEVRAKTASYTTNSSGIFSFSVNVSTAEVLSMSADGYIVIPYKDGTAWKGLVLSTALQPVASTAVSVTTNYTLKTLINDVSS